MTWWELLVPVGAFVGGYAGVWLHRRDRAPRWLRELAEGEVWLTPEGVHVLPLGTRLHHTLNVHCVCGVRRERLRTVDVALHARLVP